MRAWCRSFSLVVTVKPVRFDEKIDGATVAYTVYQGNHLTDIWKYS